MIKSVKGTRDLLPAAFTSEAGEQIHRWHFVEEAARDAFHRYGFEEIRTPVFEKTELFARGVGESTDIVNKEMFTWTDINGDSLTLRPENTAPVVRSYIEHHMWSERGLVKLYYLGPQFRRERPQKGRFRQFYQIGAEVLGPADNPAIEAEAIEMLLFFFSQIRVASPELLINSVGCPRCRPQYNETLRAAIGSRFDQLCGDCHRRYEVNPLRVFDCKIENCQPVIASLPLISDSLCEECRAHFERFQSLLRARQIEFRLAPRMVRGLDYYVRTAFEITAGNLGSQNSVVGGGRYDGLSETLGGPATKGFGFAIGVDRLVMSLADDAQVPRPSPDVFIASLGEAAFEKATLIARSLRQEGLFVYLDFDGRGLKSAMRLADKLNARYVAILGEDELARGEIVLREMTSGSQENVPFSDLNAARFGKKI